MSQFAWLYPWLYPVLEQTFPSCLWSGQAEHPKIVLSFDDGPHPEHTPELLQVLERHQVTANFFCLGKCVERYPAIAREIVQQGHWIGLHGYEHRSFPTLSLNEVKTSLLKTQEAIAQALDWDLQEVQYRIRDVRPPNGLFLPWRLHHWHQWNYRPVMWSVVPEDWVLPGIDIVVQRVLTQTRNGSLIVLHDGYYGGEAVAAIADRLIPQLKQLDYQFVTINEFWQARMR